MRPRKAATLFIFITVLLDVLSIGLIIPVLPGLVESFRGGDTASAATWVGVLATIFALMQFLFAPMLGVLSDQYGRRPVILLSCLGLGLDYILMALAPTLGWLLVGRVISGIAAASFPAANAYIADVTPPKERAAKFGLIGAAWGVGFIVGPAIGGLLGGISPRLPFWAAAGLALANFVYGLFVLPESLTLNRRRAFEWKRANPVGALKLLRSHPELFGLAGVSVLFWTAHQVLPSVFVLYTGHRYGWTPTHVGIALAFVGVSSMIVQGGLVRPVVKRIGERRTLMIGLAACTAAYAVYGLARTPAIFCLGIPLGALGGFYGPSLLSLMTRRVSHKEQGALAGANSSLGGLTGLYSPALFSLVFAAAIGSQSGWNLPGAPFVLAAILSLIALFRAWRVTRPTPD